MRTLKRFMIRSGATAVTKFLALVGVNAKEWYEYAYWKYRYRQQGGELKNAHYKEIYTERFGVPYEYYAGKRVLDIGCGPRGSLEWAENAKRRVGLDPLVNEYKNLGIGKHAMEYVDAQVEHMPFSDFSFDVVTSVNSLDHVDEVSDAIKEIKRVIAPGGEFFVIVDIHSKPTISEPVVLPWNILEQFEPEFEIVQQKFLAIDRQYGSAVAALQSRNELDSPGPGTEGVLFGRVRRRN